VRRDGMEALKQDEKGHKITEDQHRKQGTLVQQLTDEFIKKIDESIVVKEKDILNV
jgi:ribosome recycling factor